MPEHAIGTERPLRSTGLCKQHPGLQKAVNSGLRWMFIHGEVGDQFPMIPVIGQWFLNFRGMPEISEMEGLATMSESATRNWTPEPPCAPSRTVLILYSMPIRSCEK